VKRQKEKRMKTGTFLADDDDDDDDLDGDDQRFCRRRRRRCVLLDAMPLADDDDRDGDDQRFCRCCCVLLYAMPLAPPARDNQSIVCLFTELFFIFFWFVCFSRWEWRTL
jgi:hypothetical protein